MIKMLCFFPFSVTAAKCPVTVQEAYKTMYYTNDSSCKISYYQFQLHLVFCICRKAGPPPDSVESHFGCFLVLRDRVVCPADPHGIVGKSHSLYTYRWEHGGGDIWDRGGEIIKQRIIINWVSGIWV